MQKTRLKKYARLIAGAGVLLLLLLLFFLFFGVFILYEKEPAFRVNGIGFNDIGISSRD